jgi:hypothetical protein
VRVVGLRRKEGEGVGVGVVACLYSNAARISLSRVRGENKYLGELGGKGNKDQKRNNDREAKDRVFERPVTERCETRGGKKGKGRMPSGARPVYTCGQLRQSRP